MQGSVYMNVYDMLFAFADRGVSNPCNSCIARVRSVPFDDNDDTKRQELVTCVPVSESDMKSWNFEDCG